MMERKLEIQKDKSFRDTVKEAHKVGMREGGREWREREGQRERGEGRGSEGGGREREGERGGRRGGGGWEREGGKQAL